MSGVVGAKVARKRGAKPARAAGKKGKGAASRDPRGKVERDARTARQRFLPYAFARAGLLTTAPTVHLDGARSDEPVQLDRHLISLDDEEWEEARVALPIVIEPAIIDEVVAPSERGAAPVRLVVLVRCAATRLRHAVEVAGPPLSPSTYTARIVLAREQLRGSATLAPLLLRASDAQLPVAGYATLAGARLATARSWEVRVERQRPADGRFLDVRYRPFTSDPLLAAHSDNVYRLELDQSTPTLWINADHEPLVPVLGARGSTGKQARLREVFFDAIAQGVWTQLFVRAAEDLRLLGELSYPWQEVALRELLPLMYPELKSHRLRLAALAAVVASDGLGAVIDRLDAALQRKSELSRHMLRLIEEVLT